MKTALVTGADRGLGAGFVEVLLSSGYQVFAGYFNPKLQYENRVKHNMLIVPMDVNNDESIAKAFKIVSDKTNHLDLLINNAALNYHTPGRNPEASTKLGKLKRQEFIDMFQTNSLGPLFVTQTFVPLLANAKVVNVSSFRASFADRDKTHNYNNYGYAASKVALNMITRDLAHDLKSLNTVVVAINPGSIHTAINANGKLEPIDASTKLLATIDQLRLEQSGTFLDTDGSLFPN